MPIEPFEFTYTLTPEAVENEALNALGKARVKEFEPKSYFFTESTITGQTDAAGAYGPDALDSTRKFNITTQFALANKKAYAVTSGQVLIVPQTGSTDKVNVFIKPLKHVDVGVPIKYYVYRGLKKASFIDITANTIIAEGSVSNPFMTKVWKDLKAFNTGAVENVPATVFGFNTADADTTKLDAKFFNVVPEAETEDHKIFNLPIIEAGQHFGEFADNTGGFEIVLNDGFYHQEKSDTGFEFDMVYAKSAKVILDTATIAADPDISEKIYRENVHKFLDPAAFYGAHITEKGKGEISVSDGSTIAKHSSKEDIFTHIVDKFHNKHKCYLYIQCNRGRSFNFDETLGTEPLKIGVAGAVSASPYETNSWPIIIDEFVQTHEEDESDEKKGVNNLSFELKFKTVNKNVTLYNSYGNCTNETIEGNFLNNKALVDEANIATQDYTNTVNYKLTNNYNLTSSSPSLITQSIAGFIYINHEEKEVEYFNDFFGPINIKPVIKVNDGISKPATHKVTNKKTKIKYKDGFASVYTQDLIINGQFTVPPFPVEPDDSRSRLYVLKKSDSTNNEDRTFSQFLSPDAGYSYASTKEEYGAYIYGDKNYSVWKGQISDNMEWIDTLQLINFQENTNVTNFMQLGLTETDFNKLIYNNETIILDSDHIPATATNLFFHLDDSEITKDPDNIFKKYKLGIKYQVYGLLGYTETIVYPTVSDVFVYTIDGNYFFTKGFSKKFEFAEVFGNASINFRTTPYYAGEFGFDWLRINNIPNEPSYENSIVSGYELPDFTDTNTEYDTPPEAFQALKKEYINIKTNIANEIYYVPYLNIYPQNAIGTPAPPSQVSLEGVLSLYDDLEKISYEYDTNLLSVVLNSSIDFTEQTNSQSLNFTITCLKEFDKDQIIKVIGTSKNPNETIKDKVIGVIKVCKNSKTANRKNLKVVLVKVKTNIGNSTGDIKIGEFLVDEKKYLSNGLYQSFVYGDIEEVTLPLDNDPKFQTGGTYISNGGIKWFESSIHQYLTDTLDTYFYSKFKNYCICFSFDVESALNPKGRNLNGHAQDIGKQVVIVYKGRTPTTLAHEALHGLGLYHTHREEDPITNEPTMPVTYFNDKFVYHHADHLAPQNILKATDNFMSYNRNNRKTTWHWQWKIIRDNIKKIY